MEESRLHVAAAADATQRHTHSQPTDLVVDVACSSSCDVSARSQALASVAIAAHPSVSEDRPATVTASNTRATARPQPRDASELARLHRVVLAPPGRRLHATASTLRMLDMAAARTPPVALPASAGTDFEMSLALRWGSFAQAGVEGAFRRHAWPSKVLPTQFICMILIILRVGNMFAFALAPAARYRMIVYMLLSAVQLANVLSVSAMVTMCACWWLPLELVGVNINALSEPAVSASPVPTSRLQPIVSTSVLVSAQCSNDLQRGHDGMLSQRSCTAATGSRVALAAGRDHTTAVDSLNAGALTNLRAQVRDLAATSAPAVRRSQQRRSLLTLAREALSSVMLPRIRMQSHTADMFAHEYKAAARCDAYIRSAAWNAHVCAVAVGEVLCTLLTEWLLCGPVENGAATTVCATYSAVVFPLPPTHLTLLCGIVVCFLCSSPLAAHSSITVMYAMLYAQTGSLYNPSSAPLDRNAVVDIVRNSILWVSTFILLHTVAASLIAAQHTNFAVMTSSVAQVFAVQAGKVRELAAERAAAAAHARVREAAANATRAVQQATLGYASHQLRNPLHMIKNTLALMRGAPLPAAVRANLSDLTEAVAGMMRVTEDVTLQQTLTEGGMRVQLSPVKLRPLLRRACTDALQAAMQVHLRGDDREYSQPLQPSSTAVPSLRGRRLSPPASEGVGAVHRSSRSIDVTAYYDSTAADSGRPLGDRASVWLQDRYQVSLCIDDRLPNVVVTDGVRLRQLLQNAFAFAIARADALLDVADALRTASQSGLSERESIGSSAVAGSYSVSDPPPTVVAPEPALAHLQLTARLAIITPPQSDDAVTTGASVEAEDNTIGSGDDVSSHLAPPPVYTLRASIRDGDTMLHILRHLGCATPADDNAHADSDVLPPPAHHTVETISRLRLAQVNTHVSLQHQTTSLRPGQPARDAPSTAADHENEQADDPDTTAEIDASVLESCSDVLRYLCDARRLQASSPANVQRALTACQLAPPSTCMGIRIDISCVGAGLGNVPVSALFASLHNASASTLRLHQYGLSLPICAMIAQLLHARIGVDEFAKTVSPCTTPLPVIGGLSMLDGASAAAVESINTQQYDQPRRLYITMVLPLCVPALGKDVMEDAGSASAQPVGSATHTVKRDGPAAGEMPSVPERAPSVEAAAAPVLHDAEDGEASNSSPTHGIITRQVTRLLVIDDENVNVRLHAHMLRRLGFDVITGSDGDMLEPILRAAASEGAPVHAVLLDIVMKRVHGDNALIRAREAGFDVPIIAATGNASVEDRKRYLRIGFSHVLHKPFTMEQLQAALAAIGVTPHLSSP